ncbi:MAG: hypothetical protein ACOC40_02700 [Thermoplasmatota archaeon]
MTEFEEVFDDILKPAIIGRLTDDVSSDGDPVQTWQTFYTTRAYKEIERTPSNRNIADDFKIENNHRIFCPVISSSGATIEIDNTMEVVFGSTYTKNDRRFGVEDYNNYVDDHFELRTTVISNN